MQLLKIPTASNFEKSNEIVFFCGSINLSKYISLLATYSRLLTYLLTVRTMIIITAKFCLEVRVIFLRRHVMQ